MKVMNLDGKLAVFEEFDAYATPERMRRVWPTHHAWDDRYGGMWLITTLPQEEKSQPWVLESSLGGRLKFWTAATSDVPVVISTIKPPRKRRGRTWVWQGGRWQ